jgi:hypothetical protein
MDETQKFLAGIQKNARIEEIAEFVGVTPMRIRQFENAGVIKSFKDGRTRLYDKWPTLLAITKHYIGKSGGSEEKGNSREALKDEKLRRMVIRRKIEELKLGELKGDLLRGDDIEKAVGAVLTRLRINLLAIPLGAAPLVQGKTDANEIAEILENRLNRALNEVTNFDFKTLEKRQEKI